MTLVSYRCKNCQHSADFVWHDRCPICNARSVLARCNDCQYQGNYKEFFDRGCPKCRGTNVYADESSTFDEKLPIISGVVVLTVVFLLLSIVLIFLEKNLFNSPQLGDDISLPRYLWFSLTIGLVVGTYVFFKLQKSSKIKQKAREALARDNRFAILDAGMKQFKNNEKHPFQVLSNPNVQEEQIPNNKAENVNRKIRESRYLPIENLHHENIDKLKKKVKSILEKLPVIEDEDISECRQKMINQSGWVHPSMYQGSLDKVLVFVIRMIQETEHYIRSVEGIKKVEIACLINNWPIKKQVLEIEYEQFWDNNTSNVYSEHVMRIGNDQYEVFGSLKSHARMKAALKNDL